MLSILIPTYNHVCVRLVADLHRQAEDLGVPYEILVADDASGEAVKCENRSINGISGCWYIELARNVGRSRIRNILGRHARYDYLLFMDSDAAVVSDAFLRRYLEVRMRAPVVYGGILHPDRMPSPEVSLAYLYEKNAEPRFTAERRSRHPYQSFRTFNFMIAREVFLRFPFDETIVRYGHEDTLFGKTLKENGIWILHIDNPLMNCGLDTNADVLHKTEESLRMLYVHRNKLSGSTGVLRLYDRLHRWHLEAVIRLLYRMFRPLLKRNLLGRHPNLYIFAFYKIGFYCSEVCGQSVRRV